MGKDKCWLWIESIYLFTISTIYFSSLKPKYYIAQRAAHYLHFHFYWVTFSFNFLLTWQTGLVASFNLTLVGNHWSGSIWYTLRLCCNTVLHTSLLIEVFTCAQDKIWAHTSPAIPTWCLDSGSHVYTCRQSMDSYSSLECNASRNLPYEPVPLFLSFGLRDEVLLLVGSVWLAFISWVRAFLPENWLTVHTTIACFQKPFNVGPFV